MHVSLIKLVEIQAALGSNKVVLLACCYREYYPPILILNPACSILKRLLHIIIPSPEIPMAMSCFAKELEDQNNPVSLQRSRSEAVLWVSWTPGPHVQAHCSKPHRPGGQMAMNILSQMDTNQIQIISNHHGI